MKTICDIRLNKIEKGDARNKKRKHTESAPAKHIQSAPPIPALEAK